MGHLLHALHERQPLPDHSAALAHYQALAAQAVALTKPADKYAPPPCHPDQTRIEFKSAYLEGEMLTADLEIDREPLHYQHGSSRGSVEVCGLYVRGFDIGVYFERGALQSITFEAEAEAWRQIDAGVL